MIKWKKMCFEIIYSKSVLLSSFWSGMGIAIRYEKREWYAFSLFKI